MPREAGQSGPGVPHAPLPPQGDPLYRYDVNVFVDNSQLSGRPHRGGRPSHRVQPAGLYRAGIRAGRSGDGFHPGAGRSLHKANGGFLVLRAETCCSIPMPGKVCCGPLRANSLRIEDGAETPDAAIRTKGINPEPLKLDLKVVLIGTEDLYEALVLNEDRFAKLFRIKAQMAERMDRNAAGVRFYLSVIARIAEESGLRPFDRTPWPGWWIWARICARTSAACRSNSRCCANR